MPEDFKPPEPNLQVCSLRHCCITHIIGDISLRGKDLCVHCYFCKHRHWESIMLYPYRPCGADIPAAPPGTPRGQGHPPAGPAAAPTELGWEQHQGGCAGTLRHHCLSSAWPTQDHEENWHQEGFVSLLTFCSVFWQGLACAGKATEPSWSNSRWGWSLTLLVPADTAVLPGLSHFICWLNMFPDKAFCQKATAKSFLCMT